MVDQYNAKYVQISQERLKANRRAKMVKNQPEVSAKPSARVVFIAHLDLIKSELEEGRHHAPGRWLWLAVIPHQGG